MTAPDAPLESRTCNKCGQTDTDPHHVQYVAFSHPVTGEGMDLSVTKHVDCCAEDGCEICGPIMAAAPPGVHAQTMRDYLQNLPDTLHQQLLDEVGVESPGYEAATTEEATA